MFDRIAAKISSVVYNDPNYKSENGGYLNLEGWEFIKSSNEDEEGYFGAAFRGNSTIIVAHRGTQLTNIDDIKNDISIFYNKPLTQLPYALSFSKSIEWEWGSTFNYLHTGHSLGGLIAEVIGLSLEHPIISFEAPGAWEAAKYTLKDVSKIKGDNITSYLASPDFINTNGKHIAGEFHKVNYFTNPTGAGIIDYIIYSVKQHSIDSLIDEFDVKTGKPKNYEIVKKWPEGFEEGYKSFLENDEVWKEKAKYDWMKNIILESNIDPDTMEVIEIKLQDQYKTVDEYAAKLDVDRASVESNIGTCLLNESLEALQYLNARFGFKQEEEPWISKLISNISGGISEIFAGVEDYDELYHLGLEAMVSESACCDPLFSSMDCDNC